AGRVWSARAANVSCSRRRSGTLYRSPSLAVSAAIGWESTPARASAAHAAGAIVRVPLIHGLLRARCSLAPRGGSLVYYTRRPGKVTGFWGVAPTGRPWGLGVPPAGRWIEGKTQL